jgi:hypothetical protein
MAKRRVRNQTAGQIGNLIPDHKKLGIAPISLQLGGVKHTIGKLSTKVTTLL